MDWMELVIETTSEGSDLTANILYEAGAAGVVIEDPGDIWEIVQKENDWDYIDPGVLNLRGDKVLVKAYLPADESLGKKLTGVRNKLEEMRKKHTGFGCLKLTTGQVNDDKWAQSWKKHYKPLRIGQNIVIKPSWEDYKPRPKDIVVAIDPGMAFGTGTHESTVLCIELMGKYLAVGCRVIDIGCGSGILALTAAKLGAGWVEAYDIDETAVKAAGENIRLNGMDRIVRVETGSLLDKVQGRAHMIVSNIVADVIIRMCRTVGEFLMPEGVFIASGIIDERVADVKGAFEDSGLEIIERLGRGGWTALAARMKG